MCKGSQWLGTVILNLKKTRPLDVFLNKGGGGVGGGQHISFVFSE